MWIVIGIISFWVTLKRKLKRRGSPKSCFITLLFCFICFLTHAKGQDAKYTIHGDILVSQLNGDIYIFLINSETFKIPLSGIDTVIMKANKKNISFCFTNVKAGVYGIRCFQDLNDNGKLEKGFFGPSEPYGFSWNRKITFPFGFYDISFKVADDYNVKIKMEN